MLLKVWNRQGKPMLESIAYISYTVACCVEKFWKIYVYHLIICRRAICDRKRWSACSKCPKNGCWDVHLSCKVCQQLHIFKEYIRRVNLKYNCCGRVPQTGELEERDIRLDVQVGQAIQDGHCLEQPQIYFSLFDKQIQDDHQMQCIVLKMGMEICPLKTLRKCLRWKKKMWRHFECAGAAKLGFAAIRPQRCWDGEGIKWMYIDTQFFVPPFFSLRRKWGQISLIKGLNVVFLH